MDINVIKKFTLAKIEKTKNDSEKVLIYTFLDENFNKFTVIGVRDDSLKPMTEVEIELNLTIKSERFDVKNEEKSRFVKTVNMFVSSIKKV